MTVHPGVQSAAGDPVRLGQVISYLIRNASKFSADRVQIHLSVEPVDRCLRFIVAIPGEEIPEGERERVFDLFDRLRNESTRRAAGTGIGLSVCKIIVEKHAGNIWFEPTSEGINRFVFELPLEELASREIAAA